MYVGEGEDGPQLFRRRMRDLDVLPVRGTLEAQRPFYSPDKAWLGFFTRSGLEKVSLSGGPAITVCDDPACSSNNGVGGSWTADDRIVIGGVGTGLVIVSADGGSLEPLTSSEGNKGHLYPEVLPSGRAVLFTDTPPSYEGARVALYELESGVVHKLFAGANPRYAVGHVLFGPEDSLWAVPFDDETLELLGDPFLVREGVTRLGGTLMYHAAADGTLVYLRGVDEDVHPSVVARVDRRGNVERLSGIPEGAYRSLRLSPDGRRLALEAFPPSDLWVYDLERAAMTRLTKDSETEVNPLWSRDGEQLLFGSQRENVPGVYRMNADGTGRSSES